MAHHPPVAGPTATRRWRPGPWQGAGPTALVSVLVAGGVVLSIGGTALAKGRVPQAEAGSGTSTELITVSSTACAPGWQATRSGQTAFTVDNVSAATIYEVELVGANQISVYGEIEMLAAGT